MILNNINTQRALHTSSVSFASFVLDLGSMPCQDERKRTPEKKIKAKPTAVSFLLRGPECSYVRLLDY